MVFEGEMAEMLVKACPMYKEFLHVTKTGKKLLYVHLKRALYGCIKSAMLWWRMLSEFLIADGFKLNPYDSCVANKTLPCGKQLTICWYVDDLKILSVNESAVMDIIKKLEDRFGVMRKSFGKKHNYLGMQVEFLDDGSVKLSVPDHIQETIDDFGEEPEAEQEDSSDESNLEEKFLGISDDEIADFLGPAKDTAVKSEAKKQRTGSFIRQRDRFCPRCETKIPNGAHICKNCKMYLKRVR